MFTRNSAILFFKHPQIYFKMSSCYKNLNKQANTCKLRHNLSRAYASDNFSCTVDSLLSKPIGKQFYSLRVHFFAYFTPISTCWFPILRKLVNYNKGACGLITKRLFTQRFIIIPHIISAFHMVLSNNSPFVGGQFATLVLEFAHKHG
jgi:hypothetical protein